MAEGGFSRRGLMRGVAAGGVSLAAGVPLPLAGEPAFDFRFTDFTSWQARAPALGIASYQLTFVTARVCSHQVVSLAGVGEEIMRAVTQEAYADCMLRLGAEGFAPLPPATLQLAMLSGGTCAVPGNREERYIEARGSARFGTLAFGAAEAPLLAGLNTPLPRGDGQFAQIIAAAQALDALLIAPSLVIDFDAEPAFAVSQASRVILMTPFDGGRSATTGGMWLDREHRIAAPFARLSDGGGGGARESQSLTVDPAAWQAVVRTACEAFNTALVRELVTARAAFA